MLNNRFKPGDLVQINKNERKVSGVWSHIHDDLGIVLEIPVNTVLPYYTVHWINQNYSTFMTEYELDYV